MPPIMGQMVAGRVIRALIGYEPWRWEPDADGAGSSSADTDAAETSGADGALAGDVARATTGATTGER